MRVTKGAVLAGFAVAGGVAAMGAVFSGGPDDPRVAPSYSTPAARAATAPAPRPGPRYVTQQGRLFGYRSGLSDNDLAAGLATKQLTMIEFNGLIGGQYSFQTYNPVTGSPIYFKCAEPCEFMNVMNHDHRMPEVFPVAQGSIMAAMVADARDGFLNPGH